jgi:hypothetical protein
MKRGSAERTENVRSHEGSSKSITGDGVSKRRVPPFRVND